MSYDDNLPPNLSTDSNFNNEPEPRMKPCPTCLGARRLPKEYGNEDEGTISLLDPCETCKGSGEVEMTPDEIANEKETDNE